MSMIKLDIKLGIGVGTLLLGVEKKIMREEMRTLGYPLCGEHRELDYFCDNSIQIEYENDLVRFIGISDHSEIECTYYGNDVFDIDAKELFGVVARNESKSPSEEPGETCFFPDQGLNLWEAEVQYDRKGGYMREVYAQIGIECSSSIA